MKKLNKYIILMLLIGLGSFLSLGGFTYAKYVYNSIWEYYLKAMGFYFSSDYLGTTAIKNVNSQWDGQSVHFNVKNNLNESVITKNNIEYSVVCTLDEASSTYAACQLNGTELNTYDGVLESVQACVNRTGDQVDVSLYNQEDCEAGNYDWEDQVVAQDLYFDVVLTNQNHKIEDVVANITVTSNSPYRKVLIGDFMLHKSSMKEDEIKTDYKSYSNYDKLIISNSYSEDKCIKVSWDANKLLIDANSDEYSASVTDENDYINEIKFNIGAKNSLNYRFYKRVFDAEYDVTEFTITEDVGC